MPREERIIVRHESFLPYGNRLRKTSAIISKSGGKIRRLQRRQAEDTMPRHASSHHLKAAEHHALAARHHKEAAKHYKHGDYETAAHHAHIAHGHLMHAIDHTEEAAKSHAEHHGKP